MITVFLDVFMCVEIMGALMYWAVKW